MPKCIVPRCSNYTKTGIKIYMARFPSDLERKKLWITSIGKINWEPTKNSCVCEIHFANEMWEKERVDGKRKLKCNAVPIIFPARSVRSGTCIITNDQTNESSERQRDEIFETLDHQISVHGNISEKQNDCQNEYLESDIPICYSIDIE